MIRTGYVVHGNNKNGKKKTGPRASLHLFRDLKVRGRFPEILLSAGKTTLSGGMLGQNDWRVSWRN